MQYMCYWYPGLSDFRLDRLCRDTGSHSRRWKMDSGYSDSCTSYKSGIRHCNRKPPAAGGPASSDVTLLDARGCGKCLAAKRIGQAEGQRGRSAHSRAVAHPASRSGWIPGAWDRCLRHRHCALNPIASEVHRLDNIETDASHSHDRYSLLPEQIVGVV